MTCPYELFQSIIRVGPKLDCGLREAELTLHHANERPYAADNVKELRIIDSSDHLAAGSIANNSILFHKTRNLR